MGVIGSIGSMAPGGGLTGMGMRRIWAVAFPAARPPNSRVPPVIAKNWFLVHIVRSSFKLRK
jgi:hypothetical protein